MGRIAVVVAVAGLGLGACVTMQGSGDGGLAAPCNDGVCKVSVDVTSCVITPTPDPLPVKGENNIFWDLTFMSSFYRFTDDGIKLKTSSPVFDSAQKLSDSKFKMHDKGTPGSYPYAIKVQRWKIFEGWTECPTLDPTIVNG